VASHAPFFLEKYLIGLRHDFDNFGAFASAHAQRCGLLLTDEGRKGKMVETSKASATQLVIRIIVVDLFVIDDVGTAFPDFIARKITRGALKANEISWIDKKFRIIGCHSYKSCGYSLMEAAGGGLIHERTLHVFSCFARIPCRNRQSHA
jgi:hypothetical protein